MKIYMISSFFLPTIGGVENHVFNLSKSLVKKGHEVTVLHSVNDKNLKEFEEIEGVKIKRFFYTDLLANNKLLNRFSNGSSLGFLSGFLKKMSKNAGGKKILKFLSESKDNSVIIHQHDFISNIITTKRLSRKYNVFFTNHTGEYLFLKKLPFNKIILKLLLKHFISIIGPSGELSDIKFLNKNNSYYIPNGVDSDKYFIVDDLEKEKIRSEFGFNNDELVILCPRRWAPTKGVKYFIESIPLVLNNVKNVKVRFIVSGNDYPHYPEYKDEIMRLIKILNLEKKIDLIGDIPYELMDKYMKLSDIVVIPSLMEATSLAALEAMACGNAVVGTCVGGFPEIIKSGRNGLLVEPKNVQQLAGAIIELVLNDSKRKQFGEESRNLVEKEYSWDIIAEKTINVYRGINV
jgi:glycosyltransferase involved in cell wall biosynthesis